MPSLPNWLNERAASAPVPGSNLSMSQYQSQSQWQPRLRDPNAPDCRLQLATKCIYERELPGGSYITAHIERLQSGYYDSPVIHEDCIKNVRFIAIRFCFHEASTDRRFKSALIRIKTGDERRKPKGIPPLPPQLNHPTDKESPQEPPKEKPRFLRHAPHLLYGSISPETLDWNFNLAGSLGVAQTPVTASLNPSGGVKSSYKVYKMMKIQGTIRTNADWYGEQFNYEDGEIVWTLEENSLQKSGLPREFTFVMMMTKGDETNDVRFEVEIEPEIASWWGHFPQWWVQLLKYQPLYKEPLNLDQDVGQRFQPSSAELGFNFAGLMSTFDDFVTLPGTTWGTRDPTGSTGLTPTTPATANQAKPQAQNQAPVLTKSPAPMDSGDQGNASNTLHLRIHLDQSHRHGHSLSTSTPDSVAKSQRLPSATSTPSPQTTHKSDPAKRSQSDSTAKAARRVTINGSLGSAPLKYKNPRPRPLSTHLEESPQLSSKPSPQPKPKLSSDEEHDDDFEYSFPEPMSYTGRPASQPIPSFSKHRQSKSASTASSSIGVAPQPQVSAGSAPDTSKAPLTHHSLRRTRSRSGLRSSPLHSEPEDEEAISAAMDMLSGSPPPPAPSAPGPSASAPPAMMKPPNDMTFATPRTRAALADLLEVERAESARVERRNGNLNTELNKISRDVSADRVPTSKYLTSRSQDRERNRQKRYSMPVTSTGIGYPGTGGTLNPQDSGNESGGASSSRVGRSSDTNFVGGHGRSTLMIPVGSRSDSGLGIGATTDRPTTATNYSVPITSRPTALKRDGDPGTQFSHEYDG